MRLVLDGGVEVLRVEGDRRLTIEGDRLAAVFAMESEAFGSLAAAETPVATPAAGTPLPLAAWLAMTAVAAPAPPEESGEIVEIRFGGSLLIEPVESGVPVPASAEEVWVRIEGDDVRLHDESRDARIRCDLVDLRSGGDGGDRVDLLARQGVVEVEAPGLRMRAPAVRVRGPRVLVAGPGAMTIEPEANAETEEQDVASRPARTSAADAVEIHWDDRLDLALSDGEDRLRRARFEGGEIGRVRVRSEALELEAGSLDVAFLEDGSVASGGDRIERIEAEGGVVALRPDGSARLDARTLTVDMRQDSDAARPGRIEAEGEVRAFDAARVLWASALEVVLRSPGEADRASEDADLSDPVASPVGDDIESVVARGGVVAGLADGTWVFADAFAAHPEDGTLDLEGEDVGILRDAALLDGLQGLTLVEHDGVVQASTPGPGRLQAANSPLADAWSAPTPEQVRTWSWPPPPTRPAMPDALAVAAVWEGGLRYIESRKASTPGAEVATLDISDRVRARTVEVGRPAEGSSGRREDRLAADRVRVGFGRAEGREDAAADASPRLEIASMDLEGAASLERRRWSSETDAVTRPDLLRLDGPRIAYEVATGEGRVPGAGTLLVSEAATADRDARTARFRWSERLDLVPRGESETAVAITGDVELAFAGGVAGPAFTLTADRMDATLDAGPMEAVTPSAAGEREVDELDRLEMRRVFGAGRVFARGRGRDVECDAFDYDAGTGLLELTARPGRSVSVMSTTAAAPIRAERVRWNLRTDRVEIESARGEG